jgi:queuine tRNA-ribosyltransferase
MFSFAVDAADSTTSARAGTLVTPHGCVPTPAFMPVGTAASVKGLDPPAIRATGTHIVLANTYHLMLRPGEQLIAELGGLHRFMGWDGPILTDSGGYQVFSLAQMTKVTEQGVTFRSHLDGNVVELTPERAVAIQEALGSDVAMVLDHFVGLPGGPEAIVDATERTIRWAARCRDAHRRPDQALFAIVQGGLDVELRLKCSERLAGLDFPGYAIGGLSVGEEPQEMHRIVRETAGALPADKPRYLMGVGRPLDLVEAIGQGIDLFDCVLPTRNGRNGWAFTDGGTLRLKNQRHQRDPGPLETDCPCAACRHSRAYLRHLFMAGEMLGPILVSIHNLTCYQRLMGEARQAIVEGRFAAFRSKKLAQWSAGASDAEEPPEAGLPGRRCSN